MGTTQDGELKWHLGHLPAAKTENLDLWYFSVLEGRFTNLPPVLTEIFPVEVSSWPEAVCGSNQRQDTTDLTYPVQAYF